MFGASLVPSIPKSIGHWKEWIEACKTGKPTTCNFDYSGALTEANHLGNVAYRTGKKIEWNPVKLPAKNCSDAARYVRIEYRKGWNLGEIPNPKLQSPTPIKSRAGKIPNSKATAG